MKDNQPKTREEWFSLINKQEISGQSQAEFCKQRQLVLCRFGYYKKLRTSLSMNGSFSPVQVTQEKAASIGMIKIDLPNGFCCHVPSNLPVDNLKTIISTLILC